MDNIKEFLKGLISDKMTIEPPTTTIGVSDEINMRCVSYSLLNQVTSDFLLITHFNITRHMRMQI